LIKLLFSFFFFVPNDFYLGAPRDEAVAIELCDAHAPHVASPTVTG